ncbi:MAG: hypothetical protein ACXW3G_13925 [Rhodoplanes sp.]
MIARAGYALIVFSAVAITLAACGTPMRWERADTDEATLDADTVECMAIARAQHRRITERPFLVPYYVNVRDKKGRRRSIPVVPFQQSGPPVWYPYAPWLANDQIVLKHELYQRCLEAKGYQLVPDESGDGKDVHTGGDGAPGVSSDPEGAGSPSQLDVQQPDAPSGSQAQAPGDGEPAR